MKSIQMLILMLIITVTCVSGCHRSCQCYENSNKCLSCYDINSQFDEYQVSCYCNDGYFANQVLPFKCIKSLIPTMVVDQCSLETASKIKDVPIKLSNISNNNLYLSDSFQIQINADFSSISNFCNSKLTTTLKYLNKQTNEYNVFAIKYLLNDSRDLKILRMPLSDFQSAIQKPQNVEANYEKQQQGNDEIGLALEIINTENNNVLRRISWNIMLSTITKPFQFQMNIQSQQNS